MFDLISKTRAKDSRLIVGLMSGTSADGVDACLCEITGFGAGAGICVKHLSSIDYPSAVRTLLINKIGSLNVEEVARLNFLIARSFADSALKCIEEAGYHPSQIDAISSHGQTLIHLPNTNHELLPVPATLQVGDISVIAQLTGILTVGDFRPADMAQGGQGAPLVPYADFLLFRSPTLGRIVQNIGGIANLTYLPPGCTPNEVIAFDTGPGNMVIDAVVGILTQGKATMDTGGKIGLSGTVNHEFLNHLMSNEYFAKPPPKSTGREVFGIQYAKMILEEYGQYVPEHQNQWDPFSHFRDIVATISELTVQTIVSSYKAWVLPKGPIDQVILGGGGAWNPYFAQGLQKKLSQVNPNIRILTHKDLGIPDKAKEALAFAILGNNLIGCIPNNVPAATGAKKPVVMGKLALP
ncbi:MAG TPA: anhydro-N-acetylmuramic acid kinase [Firmicutes bacterium]|nr:anhydro-N-acetylmuramic acid kinase [Bacillota bacterium]